MDNVIFDAMTITATEQEAYKFVPSVVVAMIVAVPSPTAVTSPSLSTIATLVLLEYQFTVLLLALLGEIVAINRDDSLRPSVKLFVFREIDVARTTLSRTVT